MSESFTVRVEIFLKMLVWLIAAYVCNDHRVTVKSLLHAWSSDIRLMFGLNRSWWLNIREEACLKLDLAIPHPLYFLQRPVWQEGILHDLWQMGVISFHVPLIIIGWECTVADV